MIGKQLKIKSKKIDDDTYKIIVSGAIDGYTAQGFEDEVLNGIRQSHSRIILDFSEVTYISSSGIGVLISAHSMLEETDSKEPAASIIILNAQPSVRDVFNLLEIDNTFDFRDESITE